MLTGPLVDFLQKLPGSLKQTQMWSPTLCARNRRGQRKEVKLGFKLDACSEEVLSTAPLSIWQFYGLVRRLWPFHMLLYSLKEERSPAQCECAFRVHIGREVQNKMCELKLVQPTKPYLVLHNLFLSFAGSSGSCVNSYLGEYLWQWIDDRATSS